MIGLPHVGVDQTHLTIGLQTHRLPEDLRFVGCLIRFAPHPEHTTGENRSTSSCSA
jgi:hypothetical protein